jgi:hypothetical protein
MNRPGAVQATACASDEAAAIAGRARIQRLRVHTELFHLCNQ